MPESEADSPSRIVLIGLPGSGKSVVARAVARQLGWQAVDCDELIVNDAGLAIPAIFESLGEARFRELERAVIARATSAKSAVIATGGGAVLLDENRARLWRDAFVVELRAGPRTLLRRLSGGRNGTGSRPLLSTGDPAERLSELAGERAALYGLADWSLKTDGLSPAELASELVRVYREYGSRLVRRPDRDVLLKAGTEKPSDDSEVAATVRTPQGSY